MSIFTPINQVKLTNVSVVRLKKAGKRFELACYPTKVGEFRTGTTKDLDEVLQARHIFVNVSKGQLAKKEELVKAFGKETKEKDIILEILGKGEIQISGKERSAQLENRFREVAIIVADKVVNPETKTPYPVSMLEKAMAECHINVQKTGLSAKQQALEVIPILIRESNLPIVRAQMRILVIIPKSFHELIKHSIASMVSAWEEAEETGGSVKMKILIDPTHFRTICETVRVVSEGIGQVSTVDLKELAESKAISH